jgi:hypothetical protein
LLLASIGLEHLLGALHIQWRPAASRLGYLVAVGLVVSTTVGFNLWAYFGQFAGQCLYGRDSPPARFASFLGNYLAQLQPHVASYLLSDQIFFYGSHASAQFLGGGHVIQNFAAPLVEFRPRDGDVIIASPNRVAELRDWVALHSGGELHFQYDCGEPILAVYEYKAPD